MIGLNDYAPIVGQEVIDQLQRLAARLGPRLFVHINSTRTGGGVAEILDRAVPLLEQLGLDVKCEVIPAFRAALCAGLRQPAGTASEPRL